MKPPEWRLTHFGSFAARPRFSTWLIQITVNEARMRQRKQHAELSNRLRDSRTYEGATLRRDFADCAGSRLKRSEEANLLTLRRPRHGEPGARVCEVFCCATWSI